MSGPYCSISGLICSAAAITWRACSIQLPDFRADAADAMDAARTGGAGGAGGAGGYG